MQQYPHRYSVAATAGPEGSVELASEGIPAIRSAPPVEFGGPGDQWSPETLLVAAVADCFVLSFKGVARAARLPWLDLRCEVLGTLDKVDRVTRFTAFSLGAELTIEPGTDEAKAVRLLHKAEHVCLITNSLIADNELTTRVVVAD